MSAARCEIAQKKIGCGLLPLKSGAQGQLSVICVAMIIMLCSCHCSRDFL